MLLNDLPQFLKERIEKMSNDVREAFLSTITPEWVEGQVAAYELMKGVNEGRWTIEDIRMEMMKGRE